MSAISFADHFVQIKIVKYRNTSIFVCAVTFLLQDLTLLQMTSSLRCKL